LDQKIDGKSASETRHIEAWAVVLSNVVWAP
jgi:hypothetical protein